MEEQRTLGRAGGGTFLLLFVVTDYLTRDLFAVAKAGRWWCGAWWWGQEAFLLSAAAVVVKKLELYLGGIVFSIY